MAIPAAAEAKFCTASAAAQERNVRVGVYANAPKIFFNAQGNADGIMIDLLREIAREEKWQLRRLFALIAGSRGLLVRYEHSNLFLYGQKKCCFPCVWVETTFSGVCSAQSSVTFLRSKFYDRHIA